ncbi:zinc-ribbon domain-containing protein [Lutibacter sp.]
MKHCTNCGSKLKINAKFCTNCGNKIQTSTKNNLQEKKQSNIAKEPKEFTNDFSKINSEISGKNNTNIVKYITGFFLLIVILAFMDLDMLPIHPAIAFISFFIVLSTIIIGYMFKSREEKKQTLISGENLIAEWTLTSEQKENYANYLFEHEKNKNRFILYSISAIAIVIFGIFILVIDEGKLFMFLILIGLVLFLASFAYGMPFYYKKSNLKGDGKILIGAKYAYINGYFHNWDFPLSGLKKAKIITDPFYGLNLVYYYTDRTLYHSEELFIPTAEDIDLTKLIDTLKELNGK